MTICNVFIALDGEWALVGVDSEMKNDSGEAEEVSKMWPIPHRNAVVVCRGTWDFAIYGASVLHRIPGRDFEGFVDQALAALSHAVEIKRQCAQRAIGGCTDPDISAGLGRTELIIVGFSRARDRFVGVVFESERPEDGFSMREIQRYQEPWDEEIIPGLYGDSIPRMADLALVQTRIMRRLRPDSGFGGRLLVAQLLRDGMRIGEVRDLEQ